MSFWKHGSDCNERPLRSHSDMQKKKKKKKPQKQKLLARIWRSWNSHALLAGLSSGTVTLEDSFAVPQKVKYRIALWLRNSTP